MDQIGKEDLSGTLYTEMIIMKAHKVLHLLGKKKVSVDIQVRTIISTPTRLLKNQNQRYEVLYLKLTILYHCGDMTLE